MNGKGARHIARAIDVWSDRIRLRSWAHFLLLPLATFDPDQPRDAALVAAVRGVVSAFAILAFGYLLNSVSDRRMDLDARKNPFVIAGAVDRRLVHALVGLVAVSLLLAVFSPWPARLATASCLAFGCVYSVGPRIKSIPFIGSLANLGNFAPLLLLGLSESSPPPRFGYVALAFAALLLQNQLIHEAADAIEDRGGGICTTWLRVGPRWTSLAAALSGLAASGAAACVAPPAASLRAALATAACFGVAFPLLLAWHGAEPRRATRLRLSHRWCALLFGAALFSAWRWTA